MEPVENRNQEIIATMGFRRCVVGICQIVGIIALLSSFFALEGIYTPSVMQGLNMWFVGALGVACVVFSLQYWRCPTCDGFLGKVNARVCSGCGQSLVDSSSKREHISSAESEGIQLQFEERIDSIYALGVQYRKIWWACVGVMIVLFSVVIFVSYGPPEEWTMWAIMIAAPAVVGHNFAAGFYNYRLGRLWRCPACNSSLALGSSLTPDFEVNVCSSCGVELRSGNQGTEPS